MRILKYRYGKHHYRVITATGGGWRFDAFFVVPSFGWFKPWRSGLAHDGNEWAWKVRFAWGYWGYDIEFRRKTYNNDTKK